jgi:predicted ATP-grasp superfamily ATP-dependent carboligase
MGRKRTEVLLTDGTYKHTLAAARALSANGFIVDVLGGSLALSRFSKSVRKSEFGALPLSEENIEKFLQFLKDRNYSVLIPIGAKSVAICSKYRNQINQYTEMLLPPTNSLEIAFDKFLTLDFAQGIGLRIPETFEFSSKADLIKNLSNITFPVAVKDASEVNKTTLTVYFESSNAMLKSINHPIFLGTRLPVIQERIVGKREAFFGIYRNGELIDYFMHERLREIPMSGGPSTKARTIFKEDLKEQGSRLLAALRWNGIAMVEFKRSSLDNQLYLMEINPKFWGSLDLPIRASVDFPLEYTQIILNEIVEPLPYHGEDITFHWPLNGDFRTTLKNPRHFASFLSDLASPKVHNNLPVSDISPTLAMILLPVAQRCYSLLGIRKMRKWIWRMRRAGMRYFIYRALTESSGIPFLPYSKIDENIYVGGRISKIGKYYLKMIGIESVINLRSEFDDKVLGMNMFQYLLLPSLEFEPISQADLSKGVKFISSQIAASRKVFIHCAEGISRAPSMAAAYFISNGFDIDSAEKLLKKKRPFIHILKNQKESLIIF